MGGYRIPIDIHQSLMGKSNRTTAQLVVGANRGLKPYPRRRRIAVTTVGNGDRNQMSYATTNARSERLQREIDAAITEGWKIETETPERVVLVKRNFGTLGVHLLLAVLTGWWSFGFVNLAYGAYKYVNDSRRRVLRDTAACPECGSSVPMGASYCQNCGTDVSGVGPGVGAATGADTTSAVDSDAEEY